MSLSLVPKDAELEAPMCQDLEPELWLDTPAPGFDLETGKALPPAASSLTSLTHQQMEEIAPLLVAAQTTIAAARSGAITLLKRQGGRFALLSGGKDSPREPLAVTKPNFARPIV